MIPDAITDLMLYQWACACCRRIWEHYPLDWAEQVFQQDDCYPGGYVKPDVWADPRPREAVRLAIDFSLEKASREALKQAHEECKEFAVKMREKWSWANYRLGDSASGAEYEVGYVTTHTAEAAAAASSLEIRETVLECAQSCRNAMGFRWSEKERQAAELEERKIQEGMAERLGWLLNAPRIP